MKTTKIVCPRCNYFDEPHETANDCIVFLDWYFSQLIVKEQKHHVDELSRLNRQREDEIQKIADGKVIEHWQGVGVMI